MEEAEKLYTPKSTLDQARRYSLKFQNFVTDKYPNNQGFHLMSAAELAPLLRMFYFQLDRDDGELYSTASLICIRAGIHR